VTKKEIVQNIAQELNVTQLKVKQIVDRTFESIIETLVENERIELRNFGVFEVKLRAARKARNPRTEQPVYVPEKYVVTFKPGKFMEQQVHQLHKKKVEQNDGQMSSASSSTSPAPEQTPAPSTPSHEAPSSYPSSDDGMSF
jgi:nucleoid DNA-binding protein